MLAFFNSHFVEYLVVFGNAEFIEVVFHADVFADVAAFQAAGKIDGHEPSDYIAAGSNGFADEVKLELIPFGNGNVVFVHDGEHFAPVVPFIGFDLIDSPFYFLVFERTGMADVGKGSGFLGRVGHLQKVGEFGLKLHD